VKIPVDAEIKKAFLESPADIGPFLKWFSTKNSVRQNIWCISARHTGLHGKYLPDLYMRSVRWVMKVLKEAPVMV
jgi:hypothetical protein